MDSITQIALGAAMGQAVLGPKVGYRAALWGGVVATIPDLDVLIPMGGAVADFTYHRSFSHSLIVLSLLTPLLAWVINRCHNQYEGLSRRWLLLVWLALITHPVLDSFTIYGTQLFWPLPIEPVGFGSIFIIDPLYTLPLLIGVGFALVTNQADLGIRINRIGIAISTLYLAWGLTAQAWVSGIVEDNITRSGQHDDVLVTSGPFNSLLWRVVVMEGDHYREGFYSLLDPDRDIHFQTYPNQARLLNQLENHWPVERLQWFSKGFLRVERSNNELLVSDLRMGTEPSYVFTFKVADIVSGILVPAKDEHIGQQLNQQQIGELLHRIINRD